MRATPLAAPSADNSRGPARICGAPVVVVLATLAYWFYPRAHTLAVWQMKETASQDLDDEGVDEFSFPAIKVVSDGDPEVGDLSCFNNDGSVRFSVNAAPSRRK